MGKIVEDQLLCPESEMVQFMINHAERIYHVAGWMLQAASKSKNFYISSINPRLSNTSCDSTESLLTGLVDQIQAYGVMKYANKDFYNII
eukprot:2401116-Ditylum_brightwellii.AAC.1